ncbi:class I SAM-dependent DNA methyltransferase [Caldalkalibacillus salinus]|uniref:class I SAM-dependent DNA methyltransferase n=1 Tax=Caldalkalibacillus salinus TaxID=2803787 RepID=UPI0019243446|nr:class I SAM-dependent methyltransferase [Caldalkalibacillus salinus]
MSYQHLAYVYDQLMHDVPYDQWLTFLNEVCARHHHQINAVIDLGCGTGSIAIPLVQQGYKVTGIDLSETMLAVAQEKASNTGVDVQWIHQDMTELDLGTQYDTIISFLDSLNYVTEPSQLQACFHRVYQHLTDDGLFIFDVHSMYKMRHIFGETLFGTNDEALSLLWQCWIETDTDTVEHDLTYFVQHTDNQYIRYDEVHTQRGYEEDLLRRWLEEVGFDILQVVADLTWNPPQQDSERLFFICKKNVRQRLT